MHSLTQFSQFLKRSIGRLKRSWKKWIMLLKLMVNPFDLMLSVECVVPKIFLWKLLKLGKLLWKVFSLNTILVMYHIIPFCLLLKIFVWKSFLFHYYLEHRTLEFILALGGTYVQFFLADIMQYQLVLPNLYVPNRIKLIVCKY